MSLVRKRLQKPNQLETMRKIVEEVDLGKVHIHFHACLNNGNSTLQGHLALTVLAPSADAGVVGPAGHGCSSALCMLLQPLRACMCRCC